MLWQKYGAFTENTCLHIQGSTGSTRPTLYQVRGKYQPHSTMRHLQETANLTVKNVNSKIFNDSVRTGHNRGGPGSILGQFI